MLQQHSKSYQAAMQSHANSPPAFISNLQMLNNTSTITYDHLIQLFSSLEVFPCIFTAAIAAVQKKVLHLSVAVTVTV